MTLHLRPVPPQTLCDRLKRAALHRELANDNEKVKISREITDRHNERLRRSQVFRLRGQIED